MWLVLLHRLAQGGDCLRLRQRSVIYVAWVWFVYRRGFQRMVNCLSKSVPCFLGARLSAVLWGFLFGFVVLFRSKLFNIISFPFNEPG